MTHMNVHNIIRLDVTSTDTALLDNLEAELPADGDPEVGDEYDGPQRTTPEDAAEGEERLYARVALQTTYTQDGSMNQYGETYATNLYDALSGYDFSGSSYTLQHYKSPTGAVTSDEVQEWYEENPDALPTDEDGDSFIPNVWNPSNHIIEETTN